MAVTMPVVGEGDTIIYPPWMVGTALQQVWLNYYIEFGDDGDLAWTAMQQDPVYDQYFPGNRRDDGSLRLTEDQYFSQMEQYANALLSVDVNPDLFQDQFVQLIEGEVWGPEFTNRVEVMYENVIQASPAIRDYYATNYALDLTDSAIVASFLDPDMGQAIIDRQVSVAQVGGSASERGFDIEIDFAEMLVQQGMTTQQAASDYFGEAANLLPVFDLLAQRHADPDDDFDINEFTQGMIFDDPTQRRRMRRLLAGEQAQFANVANLTIAREERTGLRSGLEEV